jgi:hypothetical protein
MGPTYGERMGLQYGRDQREIYVELRVGTNFETPPSGYYMSVRKGVIQLL